MSKRQSSKYKINRRLGVNLWGRPKSPINSRDYGPGQHGQRRKKPSDYGLQLMAKQKLKGYYGNISEKQFRKYYHEAQRRRGDTSENLIGMVLLATESTERDVPEYIEVNHQRMTGSFIRQPKLEDVPYPVQMEPNLVIEFYSR